MSTVDLKKFKERIEKKIRLSGLILFKSRAMRGWIQIQGN